MKGKRKTLWALGILLCLALLPLPEASAAESQVWTAFTAGSSVHSGDGTQANPYNLFVDALDAVADGGTIYLAAGATAFINEEESGMPLVIDKRIHIVGEGDSPVTLSLRPPGIVLGANVTFRNVELSFGNPYHNAIFANGHKLTLDNVSRNTNARMVHLFAGGLYLDGAAHGTAGEYGRIEISGSRSDFGNIYAGAMDGAWAIPSAITIAGEADMELGSIYACGAATGVYNPDEIFDFVEPEYPAASAVSFPMTGAVDIDITGKSGLTVDGETGSDSDAAVSVSGGKYNATGLVLENIRALTAAGGTVAPASLGAGADLLVKEGGILDLSQAGSYAAGDFTSEGGTLVLGRQDLLTVNGTLSGSACFLTAGGYLGGAADENYSGMATADHTYITVGQEGEAGEDAAFTFIPNPNQDYMLLAREGDSWIVRLDANTEPYVPPALTAFDFVTEQAVMEEGEASYQVSFTFEASELPAYLYELPVTYLIAKDGGEPVEVAAANTGDVVYPLYEAVWGGLVLTLYSYDEVTDGSEQTGELYVAADPEASPAPGQYAITVVIGEQRFPLALEVAGQAITGVTVSGTSVTVDYKASGGCQVAAALYGAGGRMLAMGMSAASEGSGQAAFTFPNLGQAELLRVFLLGPGWQPLCAGEELPIG